MRSRDARRVDLGVGSLVRAPTRPARTGTDPASLLALARALGTQRVWRLLGKRVWSKTVAFGLGADLASLPEARKARIPVSMEPHEPEAFDGFAAELDRVSGEDYSEAFQRARMCAAGVRTLYVASDGGGAPIYAQWLVDAGNQEALHRGTGGLFPQLADDEMLLEGAYTFADFRKLGAMGDGMNQLAKRARESGARRCLTYVDADNVASLRGCARAGFALDHVRVTRRVLGRRFVVRRAARSGEQDAWQHAAAPSQ